MLDSGKLKKIIQEKSIVSYKGFVNEIIGLVIKATGPKTRIGELVYIENEGVRIPAEVVGFKENQTLLMPLGNMNGIAPGNVISATGGTLGVRVGRQLVGRVLDGLGNPLDDLGEVAGDTEYPLDRMAPHPLKRRRITSPLPLGIKAIDGLLTCGDGQRLGIFSGSGVGKSTLLGMIARESSADINVIALIGERGREVREFLERDLGEKGLKKSVVVVASSDQPALMRIKGAFLGTAIAEYFRDQGAKVILMMDSVTRFAMAQREIGLAIGEPPATKGYTPSVFAILPRLLERTGTSDKGSITGLYTVLVEGDDVNEPISDTVRGILDGHIVLSRQLASQNHYPAIDVLNSVSRVMVSVVTKDHEKKANELKELLAVYREAKDLIDVGAYQKGSNATLDLAVKFRDEINDFLRQDVSESWKFDDTVNQLYSLIERIKENK